jgi:hypothetical protein
VDVKVGFEVGTQSSKFLSQKMLVEEILPTMVMCCLELHVQPLFNATPIVTTTFDLWVSRG